MSKQKQQPKQSAYSATGNHKTNQTSDRDDLSRLADLAERDMDSVVPYSGGGLEGESAREEMRRLNDEFGLGLDVVRAPGRPGRGDESPSTTATRTVRLDAELDEKLAAFLQREGVSASAVVRTALRTYLKGRV